MGLYRGSNFFQLHSFPLGCYSGVTLLDFEAHHLHLEVKNPWSKSSFSSHIFVACFLVKKRGNYTSVRNTSVVTHVTVESMENKGLNHPYMNKAFSHKVSRICFRCWSLFICHFCITTGLFVEWGSRIEKIKWIAVHYFFCEFVSFQEDTNLISHSRSLFLESRLEAIVLHRQPLLTKLIDSSLCFLFTGFMTCRCRTAAVMFKINWQGGCGGLRVGLDVVVKKEISISVWNQIPVLLS